MSRGKTTFFSVPKRIAFEAISEKVFAVTAGYASLGAFYLVAQVSLERNEKFSTAFAPVSAVAESIRAREVSCLDVVSLYCRRIRKYNPGLHAIVSDNEASAMRGAAERDSEMARQIVRGPLHGVAVTVKESFDLAGLATTANFRLFKNNVARSDALVVERLKEAGAVILGKTNVPVMLADYQTFGPLYPVANNPFDRRCTPGGSSGGGAAAVAAGLTGFEIASDLGGSIRVPAHFCGVFGLKPTENGAILGDGHVPPPPGKTGGYLAMASIGPLARNMLDIELAWRVINQPSGKVPYRAPQKPRTKTALCDYKIAWFDNAVDVPCGEETKRVLHAFLGKLNAAGVEQEHRTFDSEWLVAACQVWSSLLGTMVGQHAPWLARQLMKYQFSKLSHGSVMNVSGPWKTGLDLRFRDFSRALGLRRELVRDLDRRFEEYDFIVSPVAAGPAFLHNPKRRPIEMDGRFTAYLDYAMPFTVCYNACGNPALVVPAGRDSNGLPIGVQIAAPHYGEPELIHFGKLIERLGFSCQQPAGFGSN